MKNLFFVTKRSQPVLLALLLTFFLGNAVYAHMRSGEEENNTISADHLAEADPDQKIFIIGDSTVRRHNVSWDNKFCGDDNPENTLRGWGDDLSLYLAYPDNADNRARQGSTAETYRNGPPGGANDEVFREIAANSTPLNRYWEPTRTRMEASNDGFLLIQFGSSNEGHYYYGYWNAATGQFEGGKYSGETDEDRINFTKRDFKAAVTFYITETQSLGMTPILVTTPVGRSKNADGSHLDGRGVFPGYVREVAAEQDVPLLDLHAKTLHEFGKYSDEKLQVAFGSCIHNPGTANEWMDRGHYEPQGAKIVAGWVKELACALPDQTLCEQFSTTDDHVIPTISLNGDYRMALMAGEAFVDAGATAVDDIDGDISANIITAGTVNTALPGTYHITYDVSDASGNEAIQVTREVNVTPSIFVYEDAEDGDVADWSVYTGAGTIDNVVDTERSSRVIELNGPNGTDDGFRFGSNWQETERHVFSWKVKYSEDFTFFISAETTAGYRIFYYQPTDNGNEITHGGVRYRFSLGTDANDGTWQTFTRDLNTDLALLDPGNTVESIYRIAIRGSGRVDDIKVMTAVDSVGDTVPPTITLNDESPVTVMLDSAYADAGAAAHDNADGDITAQIAVDNTVNTAVASTYTITYTVHDSSGNGAFATRMVEIATLHEDAEDGNTNGWSTYGTTAGSTISNVADNGGRAIEFSGNDGLDNGYRFDLAPEITTGFVTSWSMNYDEPFQFMVKVRTSVHDPLYIYYTPDELDSGYETHDGRFYIHNALGTEANDGTWRTFKRDVAADLKRVLPNETLEAILGFRVRGSGRIDDIMTETRGGYAAFTYDGHTYEIVKEPLSWSDAANAAQAKEGYLANIGSIAENHELYSRLNRYITEAEYANTVSANGGGAAYVWMGANDMGTDEGTWRWANNNVHFWTGPSNGAPVGGLFANWGRDTNQGQHEPDDWNHNQDAAAIALTEWPHNSGSLGQTSQWNDLIDSETLYYIIEAEHYEVYLPLVTR